MYACIRTYMCMYPYIQIYVYVHIYMYMCCINYKIFSNKLTMNDLTNYENILSSEY